MKIKLRISFFKTTTIVLLLLSAITGISQEKDYYIYKPNDTMPACYKLNASEICKKIYSDIPVYLKNDIFKTPVYLYAAQTSYFSSEFISSGYIYHDWPYLEKYLNLILKEIIPEKYKSDTTVHLYIIRSGSFNAYSNGTGNIFINIGVLSEVNDEATLASILAHEISHYYLKHSLMHFLDYRKGKFDLGLMGESYKLENHYTINDELQADSMAMQIIAHSKYNISGVMNAYKILERLENNQVCRSLVMFKMEEYDHPLAGVRYNSLMDYYKKFKNDTCPYFVVSKADFFGFKSQANMQILKCLMEDVEYDKCIESAFCFHLKDPDNILYIQYLLESIRRICYLQPDIWSSNFIIDRYYDTVRYDGILKKKKITDHIFTKFNYNVLPISPAEADTMKGKFYWTGDLKFKTYEQAFEFFSRLSNALGDHEYLLTYALSFEDTVNMNKYLRQYLGYPQILHRLYAMELLKGPLKPLEGAKKLIVFNNFKAELRLGNEDLPLQSFGYDTSNVVSRIIDSLVAKNNEVKSLYLPSYKKYHMKDYLRLKKLQDFTFSWIFSEKHKINIFILNPQYWEIMRRFYTNEIEFINCFYFEDRAGKKTAEEYEELITESFSYILMQTDVRRYLSSEISSIRLSLKVSPRIYYYEKENKMLSKVTGYEAVLKMLKDHLIQKEDYQKRFDYQYDSWYGK